MDGSKKIKLARQLGQATKSRRRELGLTQQQLAEAAGVSRGFVGRLERGDSVAVYPQKLIELLDVLGLDLFIVPQSASDAASHEPGPARVIELEKHQRRKSQAPNKLLQIDESLLRARRT